MNENCALCGYSQFKVLLAAGNRRVARCASCGLVQVLPRPEQTEVASLYKDDFVHFRPYLSQLPVHRAYFGGKIRLIKKLVKTKSTNLKLLDVGCAMGVFLEEAQKVGWTTVGIDISEAAVEYCRKKGLEVYQGTISSFERKFLSKLTKFDVITAFSVIEHEQDPLAMMKRVHALLKDSGLVLLTTPNHAGFWRRSLGKAWISYKHPEHLFFFDRQTIKRLLISVGFRDIETRNDASRHFPLSFAIQRLSDYFPALSGILSPVVRALKQTKLTNPISPWDDMLVIARK